MNTLGGCNGPLLWDRTVRIRSNFLILMLWGAFVLPAAAEKPLRIFTTTTDLADVAKAIVGDGGKVQALAKGYQNAHFVEAKPSLIVKLTKADVFVKTGMELEIGWASLLVSGSRNKRILPGSLGYIDASEAIKNPLEIPQVISRSMGDVHPQGNPHYMMNPENAIAVAALFAERFSKIRPKNASVYKANLVSFKAKMQQKIKEWKNTLRQFKGAAFVSYHKDMAYFADFFGFTPVGHIEPKPGIPPSTAHTANLIDRMKEKRVKLIFTHPWFEKRTPTFMAKETGAHVLTVSLFPNEQKNTDSYFKMMDRNVRIIKDALTNR